MTMDQNPCTLKWVPFCSNFNRWNPWMFIPKKTGSSVLNPIPNVILDLMFFYMSKFSQKLQYGGYEVNYYELPKRRQDQRSWNIFVGCIHASISIDKRIQSVCKPGTTHQFTKNATDLSFFSDALSVCAHPELMSHVSETWGAHAGGRPAHFGSPVFGRFEKGNLSNPYMEVLHNGKISYKWRFYWEHHLYVEALIGKSARHEVLMGKSAIHLPNYQIMITLEYQTPSVLIGAIRYHLLDIYYCFILFLGNPS